MSNLLVQLSGEHNFRVIDEARKRIVYSSYSSESEYSRINIAGIPIAKALKGETVTGYHWANNVHNDFVAWYNKNINNLKEYYES